MNTDLHFSSEKQDWETPWPLFNKLDEEFHFTLDVCADEANTKVWAFFTEADDALQQDWAVNDNVCWMNPPYGRGIGKWVQKAYESAEAGATVVCLLAARTDTSWWHKYVMKADEVRFIKGRVKFEGAPAAAPFPSAIVVFRRTHELPDLVHGGGSQEVVPATRFSSWEA